MAYATSQAMATPTPYMMKDLHHRPPSATFIEGADPRGNGSILYYKGNRLNPPEYFFSQPRAVEKVDLAGEYGLHGIMLEGGDGLTEELYPWDEDSLLHALASKFRWGNV
ncbi:hypothetical protein FOL46_008649 [Perkinsus olseni]|uniref:Uncharacterized protein n=1 Tax=Perkinsus olseni TaxID=32597 RepID=A0A7J6L621_PEROL|nr:hypothetical protein FOL46_008649 [Perkinsus olseni]